MTRKKFESHMEIAAQITKLICKVSGWQWEIGDMIIEALALPDENGNKMTQKRFRDEYIPEVDTGYVSRWIKTAVAFSTEDRAFAKEVGATWQDCHETRTSYDSCMKNNTLEVGESLRDHLKRWLSNRDKNRSSRSDSKERAENKRKEAEAARQEDVKRIKSEGPEYLSRVIHGDSITVMGDQPKESFNLIWLDPPYAQYWKHEDKRCPKPPKGTPLLCECHNNEGEAAEKITLQSLVLGSELLAEKGAIVLWQAGSEPDRIAVLQCAEDLGFEVIIPIYWDKKQAQPGNFQCPFGYQTERVLVMARDWDSFYDNGDMPGRTDVLDNNLATRLYSKQRLKGASPVREYHRDLRRNDGAAQIGTMHQFYKPRWLCRYFIERLTMPGDKVLDAFGCSGGMCQEAIALNRDYLYIESNDTNYNLGLTNIRDELIKQGLIDQE